jgi:hypothetical protein
MTGKYEFVFKLGMYDKNRTVAPTGSKKLSNVILYTFGE